eukprot:6199796-Pleurochrysis_carterae.AAC.2
MAHLKRRHRVVSGGVEDPHPVSAIEDSCHGMKDNIPSEGTCSVARRAEICVRHVVNACGVTGFTQAKCLMAEHPVGVNERECETARCRK